MSKSASCVAPVSFAMKFDSVQNARASILMASITSTSTAMLSTSTKKSQNKAMQKNASASMITILLEFKGKCRARARARKKCTGATHLGDVLAAVEL